MKQDDKEKEEAINVMSNIIIDVLTELSEKGVPDDYTVELATIKDQGGKPFKVLLSVMSEELLDTLEKTPPMTWGGGNATA